LLRRLPRRQPFAPQEFSGRWLRRGCVIVDFIVFAFVAIAVVIERRWQQPDAVRARSLAAYCGRDRFEFPFCSPDIAAAALRSRVFFFCTSWYTA
jgi:hypothetical protein